VKLTDPRLVQAARETGADVPVCLDPKPRWMRGTGEILSAPVELPRIFAVLVRPNVALATKDVFAALNAPPLQGKALADLPDVPFDMNELVDFIAARSNDLEPAAIKIAPAVARTLATLRSQPACQLARMSGSGSACFGLYSTRVAAADAARSLGDTQKDWWVKSTTVGNIQENA
jgi:4-diphosphocytidyl-2-C-methyl-D-erythritol kinase